MNYSTGNLIAKIDAKGNTITFDYDKLNRLMSKNYPDGSYVEITYTGTRIERIVDHRATGMFTIMYTYDNLFRLKSVTDVHGEVIDYSYDAVDNMIQMHHIGHEAVNYTYYDDRSVKTIEVGGVVEAAYEYNPAGLRNRADIGNGSWTVYTYDDQNRVTSISHNAPEGEFLRFDYTYDVDHANNPVFKDLRTGMTQTEDGIKVREEHYTYDDLYRLASAHIETDIATEEIIIEYSYDAVGNIASVVTYYDPNNDGVFDEEKNMMDYHYYDINDPFHGGMNRIDMIIYADSVDSSNNYTKVFDWDLNGNMVSEETTSATGTETRTFSWNFNNMLVLIESDVVGVLGKYQYDYFNRRISKLYNDNTHYFTYNDFNEVYENISDGNEIDIITGSSIDERIYFSVNTQKHYYVSDIFNSVSEI